VLLVEELHRQLEEHWHHLLLLQLQFQQRPAQQLLLLWLEMPGQQHQAAAADPRANAPPKP
jgi:hypothetical protein